VRGKLRNIAVAGAVAVLVVLMVLAASAGTGLVKRLELDPVLTRVSVPIISIALAATVCAGVYRFLARDGLDWRSAFIGGLVGGVLLDVTPTATGYYLRFVAGRTPVGVFLVLAGVLATCYLVAISLLLGAGVAVRAQLGRTPGGATQNQVLQ
jgi:uncharacterized BrkB/YihY/UPF0761 family membrane protein